MARKRHIDDAERRARMISRHHLTGTAPDVVTAVRRVAALHSSDPLTPYLGLWARVRGFTTAQLEDALYVTRMLWRLHAMRRTLFVVPSDEAPIFEAGAARDVAASEWKKLEKWLAADMDPKAIKPWLAAGQARTLALFADGVARKTQDLAKHVPELATTAMCSRPMSNASALPLGMSRSCRCSTRRRWAGPGATGTSVHIARACSTSTATSVQPCGSTGASSAAGRSVPMGRSSRSCSKTSVPKPRARSKQRPPSSPSGWVGSCSCRAFARRSKRHLSVAGRPKT